VSVQQREDAVVERLSALAPALDGEPDPAFRDRTRARLVAMAAVRTPEPAPVPAWRRALAARAPDAAPNRWRTRATAGLAGAALTVTALATLVALAADARPGDVLYGLKRGTEQTQLALAGDGRGQTLLDFASTRLEELRALAGDQAAALPAAGGADSATPVVLAAGADPELVVETLDTMDRQTAEGASWLGDRSVATVDDGPLDDLAAWAAGQSAGLAELQPDLPGEASADVQESLALLDVVSARAGVLRDALTCSSGPAVAGRDDLGPLPSGCVPVPAAPAEPGGGTSTDPTTSTPPAPTTAPTVPDPSLPVPTLPPSGGGTAPGGSGPGSDPGGGGGGLPTLPLPTLPTLPLPGGGTTPSSPGTTPPPIVDLDVCLGPIQLGDCG
jgi:hypothetical protein